MWINILNISDFDIQDDRLNLYNKDKFMLAGIDIKQIKSIEMILNLRQVAVSTQAGILYLYTDNKLDKRIIKEIEKYKEVEGIKIKVDNNKCSKDCEYYHGDTVFGKICTFDFLKGDSKDVVRLTDDNRTEYCKKFFENKELEK